MTTPATALDRRYSDREAVAVGWDQTLQILRSAELFWISTVRLDARPHVTPLVAVWADGAIHFHTGAEEQKLANLRANPHVVLTTGCNRWDAGVDVVVEGTAAPVTDEAALMRLAAAWAAKWDGRWQLEVRDGGFRNHSMDDLPSRVLSIDRMFEVATLCLRYGRVNAMTAPRIAIYGANGHTGRLVATELLARGQDIVVAGRNADALHAMAGSLASPAHVTTHVAALDDAAALRELAENATALIHCAGPFAVTGPPVASAAAAAGCHYVDHAVEPHHVRFLFDEFRESAHRSGAIMIPQTSFYGGIPDLLTATVTEGMTDIDRVTIGYSVSGWRMTPAAKRTAELLITEIDRVTFTGGTHHVGPGEVRNTVFPFPPPLGPRTMIAPFPMGEIVTIPRHVPARSVEAQLTATTFEEEQVFTSEHVDDATRAQSTFVIAVQATGLAGGGRTGHLSGRDIWRAGVLLSVEAALRLVRGQGPAQGGVFSTAEAFPAASMLQDLDTLGAFSFHGVIESAAKQEVR